MGVHALHLTVGACDVAGQEGLKMERSGMSSPTRSSLSTCINIVRKTKPGNTPDPRHGHMHNVVGWAVSVGR